MWNTILPNHSKMDQVRNFYGSNQSTIINVLYIAAFGILVYYLFLYYRNTTSYDLDLMKGKLTISGNRPSNASDLKKYDLSVNDGKTKMDLRANPKKSYTLSYWMYISQYNQAQPKYQSVLAFLDTKGSVTKSLLTFALHPTQPKMLVQVGSLKDDANSPDLEIFNKNGTTMSWAGATADVNIDHANSCNVHDIELNRWIHVTVAVSSQIVDVYMDGKLSRSCVLPKPQEPSVDGVQAISILPSPNSFTGYISGIHFSAYADTPDQIYARYQQGPYATQGFLDYLSDKIGIRVQYTGADTTTQYSDWNLGETLKGFFPSA